jgi:hypothetical protein
MRVAVVFFGENRRDKLLRLSQSLGKGLESQGHQVDVIDGTRDVNTKLMIYKYIAIGTEPISMFGGKIPDAVTSYLSRAGLVQGKRCFAFMLKTLIGSTKALLRLMKTMEGEGMLLKFSEIIQSDLAAEEIGKRLHVG